MILCSLRWDWDTGETRVQHPPGPTCEQVEEHAAASCGGLVIVPGPFASCACQSHVARKLPNGPLQDQRP